MPCKGTCLYGGGVLRNNPFLYDGSKCDCVKCPFFELCGCWASQSYFDANSGTCSNCAWQEPACVFREGEPCVVCFEVRTHIKLPLCQHFVCTVCARKIYTGSDGEFNISTAIANGPPCPNGCANPPCGRQCECYAHIELVEKWMQTESAEVEMYKAANAASVEFGEQGGVYNSQTCPVCRAEGGSWYKY